MNQQARHRGSGSAGVNLGLIITPMLDMSFQILAFFIMTYNPSVLEGNVNGTLVPPSRATGNEIQPKPVVSQPEPDLGVAVEVVVTAIAKGGAERRRTDGEPAQIYVKNLEDIAPVLIADTDEAIADSFKKLASRLKAIPVAGAANSIRLECQGDLKHQYVMQAYDVCKGSGFQNVAFVAPAAKRN